MKGSLSSSAACGKTHVGMPFGPDAFPVWRLFSLTISMVMTKSVSSSVKLCLVGVGTGASSSLVKML